MGIRYNRLAEKYHFFLLKIFIFYNFKNLCIMHGHVFGMCNSKTLLSAVAARSSSCLTLSKKSPMSMFWWRMQLHVIKVHVIHKRLEVENCRSLTLKTVLIYW